MMRSLTAVLLFSAYALLVRAQGFQPECTLPFDAIQGEDLKIDAQCGIEGAGTTAQGVAFQPIQDTNGVRRRGSDSL